MLFKLVILQSFLIAFKKNSTFSKSLIINSKLSTGQPTVPTTIGEEIKMNIDKSLESFNEAEEKLKEAEKQTMDLTNKVEEIISNARSQAESITKNIIDKTNQTIKSKEKNSLDRIKQIELSAIQSIKSQASIELNNILKNYFSNLSENNKSKILNNSVTDLKSVN
mgnify:CR=1 FL=1